MDSGVHWVAGNRLTACNAHPPALPQPTPTRRGKFAALAHFFGYEGRCSLPSNFDATYCNALGQAAGALVASGRTGLMATVGNLAAPANKWTVGGTPLLSMMHLERRAGR